MIYVTGDTHGGEGIDMEKIYELEGKLEKDDYLIILGDFGFIYSRYGSDEEMRALNWFYSMKWTTLFIDGNHENHRRLNAMKVEEWHGGKVHFINKKVIHLLRGQYYELQGKTLFCFGGAESSHKSRLVLNQTYWQEEMPTNQEYEEGLVNLDVHHNQVDYILTHDIGYHIASQLTLNALSNEQTRYFDELEDKVDYKHWYCGHHHLDRRIDDKHTCLYNTVVLLE